MKGGQDAEKLSGAAPDEITEEDMTHAMRLAAERDALKEENARLKNEYDGFKLDVSDFTTGGITDLNEYRERAIVAERENAVLRERVRVLEAALWLAANELQWAGMEVAAGIARAPCIAKTPEPTPEKAPAPDLVGKLEKILSHTRNDGTLASIRLRLIEEIVVALLARAKEQGR